jgi:hypothetical protein
MTDPLKPCNRRDRRLAAKVIREHERRNSKGGKA